MFFLDTSLNDIARNKELSLSESHTTGTREDPSPSPRPSPAQRSRSRTSLFLLVAGVLFVVFLSVQLLFFGSSKEGVPPSAKRAVAIQLEVLNGTTETNIAQRVTQVLRAGGFDVVDIGNFKTSNLEKTMVIARTSNVDAARSVASYLGIDKKKVLEQPDRSLYLEVSVVIGKDIHQLQLFK